MILEDIDRIQRCIKEDGSIKHYICNNEIIPNDEVNYNYSLIIKAISNGIEVEDILEDYNVLRVEGEFKYPSITDQLDDLFHNGIDGWRETIANVKAKYPKEVINE